MAKAGPPAGWGGGGVFMARESLRPTSTKTCWQYLRSAWSWRSVCSTNPWNANGVSVHGRSSSATYMPYCKSETAIDLLYMGITVPSAPDRPPLRTIGASHLLTSAAQLSAAMRPGRGLAQLRHAAPGFFI